MGERFLKHPPKSQIERVFGGSTNFNFRIRECRPVFVGQASAVQYLGGREKSQFGTNSTGPILLDQFGTSSTDSPNSTDSVSSTSSTRLRLLFELLNPSLRSLHLLDGSGQFPFGTDPPLADPAENREQADNGQQINCNHFLHLLSNLFCSLRTSTQSSCRIHSGRDSRLC